MGFKAWFREWRNKQDALPFKPGPCSTYDHMLASATARELLTLDELIEAYKRKFEEEKKQQERSSTP